MATASIPVDLFNPGQMFACLGFLEAAQILLGDVEGGFEWGDAEARFVLSAEGEENPVAVVLEFLAQAEPVRWGPVGYADPLRKKGGKESDDSGVDVPDDDAEAPVSELQLEHAFYAKEGDRMALPIRLGGGNRPIVSLGHWADGSSRESFKLYAGNRSADRIAQAMLRGALAKPTQKQLQNGESGSVKTKGISQLWQDDKHALIAAPFDILTSMGGSFNFDPRGAWTAIDAGYSPNDQKHAVEASPVVEFLAAWGLENARPDEFEIRKVRYSAWTTSISTALARAALVGAIPSLPSRRFRFDLALSGKNKVVTFAQEEP